MTNEEFKAWRRRCGLTQAQAGEILGYTQPHICAIERGKFPVSKALALATVGYEFQEKAADFKHLMEFAEKERNQPQITNLSKMMQNPAYWRDNNPEAFEAVSRAFRKLYSGENPGLVEDPQEPISYEKRGFFS